MAVRWPRLAAGLALRSWGWAWAAAAGPAALLVAAAWPPAASAVAWSVPVPMVSVPPMVLQAKPGPARLARTQAEAEAQRACSAADAAEPRAVQAAWQQLQQALAGGSAAQQTLALLLNLTAETDPALRAVLARQAVDLALHSQDTAAQRWAAAACAALQDGGACQRSLVQARLAAEPDNALHWVDALDLAGEDADEAWAGLAQARFWREETGTAAALAAPVLDGRLHPAVRAAVLQRLADWPPPAGTLGVSTLAQSCVHYGPGHAWGQACRHVASLMLAQSQAAPVLRLGLAWLPDEALSPTQRAEATARIARWESASASPPVCDRPQS